MQTILRITDLKPPKGLDRWAGWQGRHSLSRFKEVSDHIYHHDGADCVQSHPLIQFRGGRNGFGVCLIDKIDNAIQTELTLLMIDYATENNAKFSVCHQDVGISSSSANQYYWANITIGRPLKSKEDDSLGTRLKHNNRLLEDSDYREEQIKYEIAKGLYAQAFVHVGSGEMNKLDLALIGLPRNTDDYKDAFNDLIEGIEIKSEILLSPAKRITYPKKGDPRGLDHVRSSVEFSMPIDLQGHWSVGRLKHRGEGAILKKWRGEND